MDFLKDFKKNKFEGVSDDSSPPSFYFSTGNYTLNKVISGRYIDGGIGQGRMACYGGPSSAGKSFEVANTAACAQREHNAGVFVIDSENALDDNFMTALGVNVHADDYVYRGVSTIQQTATVMSSFLKSYRKHKETTPFLVVVDSLDALMTENGVKAFDDGEVKGDQGQHAKQIKAMLAPVMHEIKDLNVAILCTKQVYQEQDPMLKFNPMTAWKLTESTKYPFSQIALFTKLFLKNKATKEFDGFILKASGLKTRFTKPFQQCILEVPYDTGMNPYGGLLEAAEAMGVVEKNKGWYTYGENKFQSVNFGKYQEEILHELVKTESRALHVNIEGTDYDEVIEAPPATQKQKD